MKKSTLLTAMVGLFLAVTLIWSFPGYAQAQGGQGGVCPRGYTQGGGPGGGGGPGNCPNYNAQNCPQYGYGKGQGRGRNRARWNPQAPTNPNPQTQTQTPAPQSGN